MARHRIELTRDEAERGVAGARGLNDGKLFLAPVPAQPCSIFIYVPASHHTDGHLIDRTCGPFPSCVVPR
jgi:hypothetical protein